MQKRGSQRIMKGIFEGPLVMMIGFWQAPKYTNYINNLPTPGSASISSISSNLGWWLFSMENIYMTLKNGFDHFPQF